MDREANIKKIKTESGQKIAASYKSQAYKKWREKHKIDSVLAGEENEAAVQSRGGMYVCALMWLEECFDFCRLPGYYSIAKAFSLPPSLPHPHTHHSREKKY